MVFVPDVAVTPVMQVGTVAVHEIFVFAVGDVRFT